MKIGDIVVFIILILVSLALSPIILPVMLFLPVRERFERRRFTQYLKSNPGRMYFAYTSRTTSVEYVRANILPNLSPDVSVIYLSDKAYNLGNDYPFIDRLVISMKATQGGFPYAAQIENGELRVKSVNNQLYSAIKRKIGAEAIVSRIEDFYDAS